MIERLSELNTQSWEVIFNGGHLCFNLLKHKPLAVKVGSAHPYGSRSYIGSTDSCINMISRHKVGTLSVYFNLEFESEPHTFLL